MRWKHRLPRVGTDRQATDFVDHEQAVAGKEAHALAQRAIARSLGDSSLAPLMIKTRHLTRPALDRSRDVFAHARSTNQAYPGARSRDSPINLRPHSDSQGWTWRPALTAST
jgi:hypothetical protein